MRAYLTLASLLACSFSYVSATALTYKLVANEKACFFSNVEQQGAKIAFYFAVSHSNDSRRTINIFLVVAELISLRSARYNLAAPLMSTTAFWALMGKSSWRIQRNGS